MSEKTVMLLVLIAGVGVTNAVLYFFGAWDGLAAFKTWADVSLGATAFRTLT